MLEQNMSVPVVVIGAGGRMGRAVIAQILSTSDLQLAGAVVSEDSALLGRSVADFHPGVAGGLHYQTLTSISLEKKPLLIDFSSPEGLDACLDMALHHGLPLVTGTTGMDGALWERLRAAGDKIPVVAASNMSVGVAVLREAIRQVSRQLGAGWDAEILELHHRRKRDSPSGTAISLAETLAESRDQKLEDVESYRGRGQTGPRQPSEIGMAALRGGGIIGEHTVYFIGEDERLEFTHRAMDRSLFASGALRAGRFARSAKPGLYDMPDILGFERG